MTDRKERVGGPRKTSRPLSDSERAEWEAIARTIAPLARKEPPAQTKKIISTAASAPSVPRARLSVAMPSPPRLPSANAMVGAHSLPRIETRVLRALKRGQIELQARLDLHGETQPSAHRALIEFLADARRRQFRVVLIVTGKGVSTESGRPDLSRGILRRMLPEWLSSPSLASWILGLSPAGPAHGGAGAFYVALRRER